MSPNSIADVGFSNIKLIEDFYEKYLQNPESIDPSWSNLFEQKILQTLPLAQIAKLAPEKKAAMPADLQVFNLIEAYRSYGHLLAKINPIATHPIEEPVQLKLENLGFSHSDLKKDFPACGLLEAETATLQQIIDTLKSIYCEKIGYEYKGLQNPNLEKWLQERIEPQHSHMNLSIDQKKMILQHLNRSELFESFLQTKYTGQKRFSLEGGETLIPVLEAIIEAGAGLGQEEFIIGMAHRGRLNVLSNILNKSYGDIFTEFEEGYIPESFEGSGDVKYHKGFYSEVLTVHGHKVRIILTPNPSHLEAVDPVVEGQVYAKQVLLKDYNKAKVLPILVHGDAALSGQGIVYETLQLYKLEGYSTGGTIHVVINNQIGFTTLPRDSRSTYYCTDIAHAFGAPVFHVNAEDPEACIFATILALEIRHNFNCDVFIDINCYRKYGHNETDEPAFTQPLEYQLIRKKKPIREIYRDDLIQQGVLEKKLAEELEEEFKKDLHEALQMAKVSQKEQKTKKAHEENSSNPFEIIKTGVSRETLQSLAERFSKIPEGFTIHQKLEHLLKDHLEMVKEGDNAKPVDWGMGETLAYATLLWNGIDVRISGQDSCRGTFSHRHGMWMDQVKEQAYFPLKHLKEKQGRFDLINSPLSEYAVVGFEFGYSIANPDALVIWEAQFGDFCNGAQVIIDQFISTAEQKWGQKFGLVMFLPHGYEGQGPEHSSARIERFLTLAGNNNIQIVNPTNPAQLFHLLRRQVMRTSRKPLVVFTPKGLLRHPNCVSPIKDFTQGSFLEILDDPHPPKKTKTLVFCSGRIYYDLIKERADSATEDMVIIRIEQLYPLHIEKIEDLIKKYNGFEECIWVQEEPNNMGAWSFISPRLIKLLPENIGLKYIGRPRSASPAAGSYALHKKEYADYTGQLFKRLAPTIFDIASKKEIY